MTDDSGPKRILVVDSDRRTVEWLKILLEHCGYDVRTAYMAGRGEELFRTWSPHLVITEAELADQDGVELLQTFKSLKETTPIIMIAENATVPLIVRAMQIGSCHFLQKPLEADHTVGLVEHFLQADAAAVPPATLAAPPQPRAED